MRFFFFAGCLPAPPSQSFSFPPTAPNPNPSSLLCYEYSKLLFLPCPLQRLLSPCYLPFPPCRLLHDCTGNLNFTSLLLALDHILFACITGAHNSESAPRRLLR